MEVGPVQDALRWAAIHTILAPTDLSAASLPGVLQTAELAQRLRARLILMTAIPRSRATGRPADIWIRLQIPRGCSLLRGSRDTSGRRDAAVSP